MRVAIIHDYLHQYGGAEKCIEAWLESYPEADIYTSIFVAEQFLEAAKINKVKKENRIYTSWLNGLFKFKFWQRFQKHLFWLYPIIFSFWTVKDYDLVIVSSSYCAKNIRLKNCKKILVYCYTPTRFLYGQLNPDDQKTIPKILRISLPLFFWWLRVLDEKAVKNLKRLKSIWIAQSEHIKKQLQKIYKVESEYLINPPVDVESFSLDETTKKEDFFLILTRISFHKRVDLAILACLAENKNLKIAGGGIYKKEVEELKKLAQSKQSKAKIEFLGRVSDQQKIELMHQAKAFIFPVLEDFGITPVESLASGTPVIAYRGGGALEYIKEGFNGIFFEKQTPESLGKALVRFEQMKFNTNSIVASAQRFNKQRFVQEFRRLAS